MFTAAALILSVSLFVPQIEYGTTVPFTPDTDSLTFTNWTVEDGLPVNATNEVTQGKKGYLWITTYDGLVRFNGLDFKIYNNSNTPAFPHNRMNIIYYQKGVGLWIVMEYGGIVLKRNKTFKLYNQNNGFTDSIITSIVADSTGTGRTWIGTQKGLFVYEDNEFNNLVLGPSLRRNDIVEIYTLPEGFIWAATHDGLVKINPKNKEYKVFNLPDNFNNIFTSVAPLKDNTYLVGTSYEGLWLLKEGRLKPHPLYKEEFYNRVFNIVRHNKSTLIASENLYLLDDNQIVRVNGVTKNGPDAFNDYHSLFKDSRGTLWMVSLDGWLAWLKNDNGHRKMVEYENPENYWFNHIYEDREGNIWVTTARSGIVQIKRKKVKTIGTSEGLSGDNIMPLFEDSRGRFWVGTRDEGLNIIDDNTITKFNSFGPGPNIASMVVHAIAEDKKGNIWAGYYINGVDKFTEKGITHYKIGEGRDINDVHAIFVSRDSTIWLGTYGGLVKFDQVDENHTVYTAEDGLAGNRIRYIDEDRLERLWIATRKGLSMFHGESFKNYTVEDGLSDNNLRSVYVDEFEKGVVWVGTENNGLNRLTLKNGKITYVNSNDGLPNDAIHFISQDSLGWLWLSTNGGIVKIKKSDLNDYLDGQTNYYDMVVFDEGDGMRNRECNGAFQQGGLHTSEGTFWFATQEGVAIIDINPELNRKSTPPVVLNNIIAGGETFTENKIKFDPDINGFEIQFTALTYTTPRKTRYRYKLVGYDEKWHEVFDQQTVRYSGLSPGKYLFKVKAANDRGIWSEHPATATLTITPFFYEQWWFYLFMLFIIGTSVYGSSRLRNRYLLKKQEKLNAVIHKRTAELTELNKTKNKLFSIIGHDLRNPLGAIIGLSELLAGDHKSMQDEEKEECLHAINQASTSLHQLVENLLSWSQLENNKLTPRREHLNANTLIQRNTGLLSQQIKQKKLNLKVKIEQDVHFYGDENMVNTIIRNLLSNAVKFTETGGAISIKAYSNHSNCHISISDTGIGMNDEILNNLNNMDKNTRQGTNNEKGTGLGFMICKEMTELQNGSIKIASEEGKGSTFTLMLPNTAAGGSSDNDSPPYKLSGTS